MRYIERRRGGRNARTRRVVRRGSRFHINEEAEGLQMVCKVRYLNSAGIMRREIKGVDALAKAFPPEWLLYVALNCYPRNQDPMEIDALVVIEDQILLLEIKDWDPKLTYQNDRWFVGGQSRGRSAVIQGNEKARKLKSVLGSEIPKSRVPCGLSRVSS
jgi:hypothetical protein